MAMCPRYTLRLPWASQNPSVRQPIHERVTLNTYLRLNVDFSQCNDIRYIGSYKMKGTALMV